MLIDGKEVIYSMKDRKIVYPEIPTEGLVCYLDPRGKTNTDKHKGTLLDLSGNGNHGTLHNFNFTEESGYVKGLSEEDVSGLKFDGVDDNLAIRRDFTFSKKPFTYFIDFNMPRTAKEQNVLIRLGWGFYLHKANNRIYNHSTNNPNGNTYGDVEVTVGRHIFVCSMGEDFTKTKYFLDGISIFIQNKFLLDGTPVVFMDSSKNIDILVEGEKKINRLMIWNRQLTDTEITQLMEE